MTVANCVAAGATSPPQRRPQPSCPLRRVPSPLSFILLLAAASALPFASAFTVGRCRHSRAIAVPTAAGGGSVSGHGAVVRRIRPDAGVDESSKDADASRRGIIAGAAKFAAAIAATTAAAASPSKTGAVDAVPLASGDATSLDPTAVIRDDAFPPITHRVYFDIRISRSDGTFYVRDDLPDDPENRVFSGRLTFGLFGDAAPVHVRQFLKYVEAPYNPADDLSVPSYGRSTFTRLDQGTGLLSGGNIPGLELTDIGGGTNMRYGGRILPAPLWIESRSSSSGSGRVSHALGSGLLTHRSLDPLPTFGITTRPAPDLDPTHVVFGRVLPDNPDAVEFIRLCVDLPTYSMDRPSTSADLPRTTGERAAEQAAGRVFAAQREFFRGAAKTFGDTRLDKVYEGKLLRRVEVTRVGLL